MPATSAGRRDLAVVTAQASAASTTDREPVNRRCFHPPRPPGSRLLRNNVLVFPSPGHSSNRVQHKCDHALPEMGPHLWVVSLELQLVVYAPLMPISVHLGHGGDEPHPSRHGEPRSHECNREFREDRMPLEISQVPGNGILGHVEG
eukprot:CAMPEP_0177386188 /NCGR_PEP_ID=MMETSP0368-20130122/50658_1 /TAXON_ID=447022 ORGANISM="Scrippsiella hangoei-like, Strain SHHI-4" /NCGR_SAMPLE_ID=MMETSP0368 /ASSEMBLY_ACC=CAM_ASM_000363 /LENGTH=146 /DNA_ID=CAMNT_0018851035 /DNA_START=11 /DNA_END=449 /DNA_ORIENTATION=+